MLQTNCRPPPSLIGRVYQLLKSTLSASPGRKPVGELSLAGTVSSVMAHFRQSVMRSRCFIRDSGQRGRCWLPAALLLLGVLFASAQADDTVPADSVKTLPPAKDLLVGAFPGENWTFVSGRKDAKLAETWSLSTDSETGSPILICTGLPHGYLKSRGEFQNFDLSLEWRFPKDPNGNSGVLLFTAGEDRVWPASIQVQFHQAELGSAFPIGGAKSTNEFHLDAKLAKPVNQWNRAELICRDGKISVTVNGHAVGEVLGCVPSKGAIGLQSEGSEIHFRAISIREIPVAQTENPSASADRKPQAETLQSDSQK